MQRSRPGNKKQQGQSPLSKQSCVALICLAGAVSVTPVQASVTDIIVGTQGRRRGVTPG
ncbi:hypothetical protein O4O00_21900 [Citrobacter sedlakii]|uniref:hypothetical protein n=1 Tax=Citrobacter sedlakii TaxID=67826 RepID=UPI00180491D5|nr:hypothetical protein [Citrobacter sedlakii]EFM0751983.1 hypothetical protein [Salmonella enterica subsp. enterica serovar Bredeney]EHS1318645.1 hypothetical protein [Salmonella enterica subsp. enterica serovar Reading]MCZ4677010.1 hypothetical protein [Citrobacter sedlakii]MDR5007067.1 hypothetical protein [Citrobacter sedlakii]